MKVRGQELGGKGGQGVKESQGVGGQGSGAQPRAQRLLEQTEREEGGPLTLPWVCHSF